MLPEAYLSPPPVRANLVQGLGGVFTDSQGSSRGISNQTDLARLLDLRALCDIVVTDGETARLEKYRIPLTCDLGVITRLGYSPEPSSSTKKYIELKTAPGNAVRELLGLGYKKVLLEVGPKIVAALIADGLVDELCLTNTQGSKPNLSKIGVANAQLVFQELQEDTGFTIWSQIQGV
jgi:riboflavin biosynthesis pyrimidine reductase